MTPTTQTRIDEQHPWPGLGAFDEQSERFFNGRDEETAELRRLVLQSPLTVLFGMSGLGKTSLLQAGLFPLLRRDHVLPVYVRLDIHSDAPLIDQVRAAFVHELSLYHVDAPAFEPDESLWSYLHRSHLELWSRQNHLLTPLFVFDQFEETFTLGADHASAVGRLRRDISDLVENRVPIGLSRALRDDAGLHARFDLDAQRYRVLLSFREDFLPAVEGWKDDIPSLLRNRLRLLPLSAARAFDAVHKSAPHLVDPALARRIVEFVAAAQDRAAPDDSLSGELLVEPALLSLVCHGLNEQRLRQRKAMLDEQLLADTGSSIIADFYKRAVSGLREQIPRFIEAELITERGYRKPCDVDDAKTRYGLTDEELATLVDRRLLRIEPSLRSDRVELTHDLLTGVVKDQREIDRRRDRARRRARAIGRRALLGVGALVLLGIYLEREHTNRDRARELETQAALMVLDTIVIAQAQASESRQAIDAIVARLRDIQQREYQLPFLNAAQRRQLEMDRRGVDSLRRRWNSLDSASTPMRALGMQAAAKGAVYVAGGRLLPYDSYSRLDLFDASRRDLSAPAEHYPDGLFGDSIAGHPEPEAQPHFLPDAREDFQHVIEWKTHPLRIGSIAVFLSHDGTNGVLPTPQPQRAVKRITLKAMLRDGEAPPRWTTIAVFQPSLPYGGVDAFGDLQPLRSIAVCIPTRVVRDGQVAARRRLPATTIESDSFRLEVVAASIWGPRLTEIDAYPDAGCSAPSTQLLTDLASRARLDRLTRDYASSTIAISLVLSRLPASPWWQPTARDSSALTFLANTHPDAWNRQQIRWAGRVLTTMARDNDAGAALAEQLTRIDPHWGNLVAASVVGLMMFDGQLDRVSAAPQLKAILDGTPMSDACVQALRSVVDQMDVGPSRQPRYSALPAITESC